MENIVIKLVVEGNAKEATNQLDKLSDKEKEVKKNFDAIAASAKKAGQETKKAGKEAENGLDKLNDSLKGIATSIAGAFAVEAIVQFGKESVKAFAEAEEMGRKLEFAVKNIANGSDGALDMLLKQAEDLKSISIFDDDDIINAQQALITFGLTTDQVAKLTPKIVDLASATGMDLAQATDKMIAGINGQTKGLRDVGLQFKDTGSKVENYNIILEKLNKFQGATADATNTTMGALKRFDVFIGDLKENTGEFLSGMADGFAYMWDVAINGGEKTVEQLKLNQQELENMQKSMVKLGFITDLQAMSDEDLLKSRLANEQLLDQKKSEFALKDINIQQTVGKFYSENIDKINAEIQRRKDLGKEIKQDEDAYEKLTSSISALVAQFQNELAAKKQLKPEDIERYKNLVKEKNAIDELIKKLTEVQEARKKGITKTIETDIDTTTTENFNKFRLQKEDEYLKNKEQRNKNQIDKTIEYNKKALEENNKAIAKFEAERDEKDLQDALKKREAIMLESLTLTATLSNIFFEQQLSQISQERDARLRAIEDEKNARINQAGITNKKRLEYEKQYEQEKQQVLQSSFEQEKRWKKQQAFINGALAITNILATTPDPTGVYTALRIAGAIATTAAQVAQIDAQKFEKGGWIGGKRHREGGTIIEAEKDEFVVNRNDAQKNKDLLTNLNKGLGEKYIYENFVRPAIIRNSIGETSQKGLAENIANSLKYQMYDDHYLRKALKQTSMQSAQYIVSGLKSNQKPSRYV